MAASKCYYARSNLRFLDAQAPVTSDSMFELEESDVWTTALPASPLLYKPAPNTRFSRKHSPVCENGGTAAFRATPSALPRDVPDWSKILKGEGSDYRRRYGGDFDGDEEEDDGGANRVPPHEFLARTRMASFSVHEGVGRTLKGRDLSRVRNLIWQQTGFED